TERGCFYVNSPGLSVMSFGVGRNVPDKDRNKFFTFCSAEQLRCRTCRLHPAARGPRHDNCATPAATSSACFVLWGRTEDEQASIVHLSCHKREGDALLLTTIIL
ncbi:unnamed protein product, partial [Scytosiphon promiscuus]